MLFSPPLQQFVYLQFGFELFSPLHYNILFPLMFCLYHSIFRSFTPNLKQNAALSHLLAKRYLASKYPTLKGVDSLRSR